VRTCVLFAWGLCCVLLAMCLEFLAEMHTVAGHNIRQLAGDLMEYGKEIGMGAWD
jgi:hypothetical protein